jgi:hypothetical protein
MPTEVFEKMVGKWHVGTGFSAEVEEHGDVIIDMYLLSVQYFFRMG